MFLKQHNQLTYTQRSAFIIILVENKAIYTFIYNSMQTEFLSFGELIKLQDNLRKGDKIAIKNVIDELSRLENIIKDFELGFSLLQNKMESKTNKKPTKA
jgi:hypothetical protein